MLTRIMFISLISILVMGLFAFPSCIFGGERAKISGVSMEPTFHDGESVTISSVNRELQRGDIVKYTITDEVNDNGRKGFWLKRIIGLPGENIEFINGKVYINGVELNEPYLLKQGQTLGDSLLIPEGHYFIMGDNRNNSYDSRQGGPISKGSITGIVNR